MATLQETYLWAGGCILAALLIGGMTAPASESMGKGTGSNFSERLVADAQQYHDLAGTTTNAVQAFMYSNYAAGLLRVVDYKTVSANVNLPDLERNVEKRQQHLMARLST
jgi:hypothetical protein